MQKLMAILALSTLGMGTLGNAQDSVVVVELYTSQGCSSCPAADEILAEVAKLPNVIALSLHVDYWDYLGWKDNLAKPEFTARQAKFNTIMKSRYRLVTPQMIFNGQDNVAGPKHKKTLNYVTMLGEEPEKADLTVQRVGAQMEISLAPMAGFSAPADVYVVRFDPSTVVAIKKGENAGKTINYVNTVTEWTAVAQWNGTDAIALKHPVDAKGSYAVIVQTANLGPLLVARSLK
jgi:hypothetical protein